MKRLRARQSRGQPRQQRAVMITATAVILILILILIITAKTSVKHHEKSRCPRTWILPAQPGPAQPRDPPRSPLLSDARVRLGRPIFHTRCWSLPTFLARPSPLNFNFQPLFLHFSSLSDTSFTLPFLVSLLHFCHSVVLVPTRIGALNRGFPIRPATAQLEMHL